MSPVRWRDQQALDWSLGRITSGEAPIGSWTVVQRIEIAGWFFVGSIPRCYGASGDDIASINKL
jgi:hypothetical protein